jgi:transposase
LKVIKLHLDGRTNKEIAEKLDYTRVRVWQLIKEYRKKGLIEYSRHKYGGNNRSLSFAEEAAILSQFDERIAQGELVTAQEIKKAFDEKRGKDTGRGYIYMLLERHNFRMVMPRSKHPKKAADDEIESSKKLT